MKDEKEKKKEERFREPRTFQRITMNQYIRQFSTNGLRPSFYQGSN